jgi:hypothetical protein
MCLLAREFKTTEWLFWTIVNAQVIISKWPKWLLISEYIYICPNESSHFLVYLHKCSNESHDFPNALMSSRSILSEEQWHHDLSRPRWNHIYYSPAPNSSNTLLVITTFEKAKTYTFIINSSLANFWTFPLTHTTLIDHEQQWNSPILDFCYSQDQANAP